MSLAVGTPKIRDAIAPHLNKVGWILANDRKAGVQTPPASGIL
jgi:hypothetical protein